MKQEHQITTTEGSYITVASPASIANLVCGFDILGLSLNSPEDLMRIEYSGTPGIRIKHTDEYNLPTLPEQNVAGAALLAMMQELPPKVGFEIIIDKRIKPGSGLGS